MKVLDGSLIFYKKLHAYFYAPVMGKNTLKKNIIGANRPYLTRKWWVLIILDPLAGFFFNFFSRGQEVHQNYINGFSKKILVVLVILRIVLNLAQ